jgi:subtilisin family serine protease
MPSDPSCVTSIPSPASNNWDVVGHGTQVASIAAGNMRVDRFPFSSGIAPGAALLDLKVFGCEKTTLTSTVNLALEWIIANHNTWSIDVVNLSLGADALSDGTTSQEMLVNIITSLGMIVVIAAGNSGPSLSTIGIPASAHHVITVGAMRMGNTGESLSSYSSKGPTSDGRNGIDIIAPGTDYYTARARASGFPTNYELAAGSGTSFAAPFVSGLAALALAANPSLRPSGDNCNVETDNSACTTSTGVIDSSMQNPFEALLKQDCADWGVTGDDPQSGCGYIRAARTLQRAYSQTPSINYPTLCRSLKCHVEIIMTIILKHISRM